MWTFVLKKQGRLTPEEKQDRYDIGDMYLWTAVDKETKLIPAFLVGKRSADNARRFLRDVASRLVFPSAARFGPPRISAWRIRADCPDFFRCVRGVPRSS